ncbi:Uncharacterised protein [Zhongshania aliphaticivorans]|uniref:Uncharacterized protein n=1 Tax=Zhongshania aliphaticivorans TaxID=1470434 RepID=A0A5S9MZL0_9GAMM|nr:hypothetical protein [Zhongshania aliphaticivorans]CAA0082993.1 Uncharacterised protein [Zhongshania aliphaticivorans]CAA0083760.1 Uncharacterised protein [Zhongshania aliphaticivorans]
MFKLLTLLAQKIQASNIVAESLTDFEGFNMQIASTRTVFGLDATRPESILFLLLLAILLSVSITTGTWDLGYSRIVMFHELVFSGVCLVFVGLNPLSPLSKLGPL